MNVVIPGGLRSYTEHGEADASGDTLDAVLADLDRRYPGIRFRIVDEQHRIRPHIRFFVDGEEVRDLARPLDRARKLIIVQALSGG